MGIEVADCTIEFAANLDVLELLLRAVEPRHDVGEFFAQRRRAGCLAMGSRQHRQSRVVAGHGLQFARTSRICGSTTSWRAARSISA